MPPPPEPLHPFPSEFFRREDESDDRLFYAEPRLVVHIDEQAVGAIGRFFEETLPRGGSVLDLMSSWRSHLPDGHAGRVVGLGLNAAEMAENPQLDEWAVHDLNSEPHLPFEDAAFDAAVVTVSIQYMTQPIEVFREVHRTLRSEAGFHVAYSNRMFPAKAVSVWKALDDVRRADLIGAYFAQSGGWEAPQARDITPQADGYSDPVFVVSATKK